MKKTISIIIVLITIVVLWYLFFPNFDGNTNWEEIFGKKNPSTKSSK